MKVLRRILLLFYPGFLSLTKGQSNDLQSCLTGISGLVTITSADSGAFGNATRPFNLRFTPSPAAIVYPVSPDEVSHVVACASNSGMNVSARSGGHSYAAYGLSGNVVIDLSKLKNLTVDATGKAVSETGLLLGELAQGLWDQGQRALPHGSCPYVGTGGHALYGGFGYYSRMAGLLLDRILSANVVLANGTIVTASNTSNVDIFWALRGAGPSFGIVTSWTFDTLPAPTTTVYYQITFVPPLSAEQVASALINWEHFAVTAPNELAMSSILAPTGKGSIALTFQGTYYGELNRLQSIIGTLLPRLPSSRKLNATALGWMDGLVAVDGDLDTSQPDSPNTFFAKSLVITQPSTNDSISAWVKYLFGPGLSPNITWFAQIDLYGGAISSVSADATAFAHRDAFMVYQLYASSPSTLPPYPSDGITFVNNMLTALEPNPKAAYPNYIDPSLTTDQWQSLYFADHITRLEQIKREIDPNNVFDFQQAIPPASSSATSPRASASDSPSGALSVVVPRWTIALFMILYMFVDITGSPGITGTS